MQLFKKSVVDQRPQPYNCVQRYHQLVVILLVISASGFGSAEDQFCQTLSVKYCSEGMEYKYTVSNPREQREASAMMKHFKSVIARRLCHPHFFSFLCLRLSPVCMADPESLQMVYSVLPCRDFCLRMKRSCAPKIRQQVLTSFRWPESLACHDLPEKNCADPNVWMHVNGSKIVVPTGYNLIPDGRQSEKNVTTRLRCPANMSANESRKFSVGSYKSCGIPCGERIFSKLDIAISCNQLALAFLCPLVALLNVVIWFYRWSCSGQLEKYQQHREQEWSEASVALKAALACTIVMNLTDISAKAIVLVGQADDGLHCDREAGLIYQHPTLQDGWCMASFLLIYPLYIYANLALTIFALLFDFRCNWNGSGKDRHSCYIKLRALLYVLCAMATITMVMAAMTVAHITGSATRKVCELSHFNRVQFLILPLIVSAAMPLFVLIRTWIAWRKKRRVRVAGLSGIGLTPDNQTPEHVYSIHTRNAQSIGDQCVTAKDTGVKCSPDTVPPPPPQYRLMVEIAHRCGEVISRGYSDKQDKIPPKGLGDDDDVSQPGATPQEGLCPIAEDAEMPTTAFIRTDTHEFKMSTANRNPDDITDGASPCSCDLDRKTTSMLLPAYCSLEKPAMALTATGTNEFGISTATGNPEDVADGGSPFSSDRDIKSASLSDYLYEGEGRKVSQRDGLVLLVMYVAVTVAMITSLSADIPTSGPHSEFGKTLIACQVNGKSDVCTAMPGIPAMITMTLLQDTLRVLPGLLASLLLLKHQLHTPEERLRS